MPKKAETPEIDPASAYDLLASLVRRIEALDLDRATLNEDIKEIYREAKGTGFDTKILRQVIRKRKQDPEVRRELEESIELYETALERAGSNAPGGQKKADPLREAG